MTDQEAIEIAKRLGLPVVRIPPIWGAIDEIITVDFRNRHISPIVTREPSSNFGPGRP